MADQDKTPKEKAEKTIGKEKVRAKGTSNGAPAASKEAAPDEAVEEMEDAGPAETVQAKVKERSAEIAETYAKAKRELHESVSKLRSEISKIDVDQARQRARTWVEENPALAVALAIGAGIVIGRLASALITPAPPPLSKRLKKRGRKLASQAQLYAHDVGDVVAERAAEAVDVLSRKAHEVGEAAIRRAHEIGEQVAHHASDVAEAAAERAAEWGDTVSHRSARVVHAVHDAAQELPGMVREKTSLGFDLAESLLSATKAVTAALVVKKVTDWFRRAA